MTAFDEKVNKRGLMVQEFALAVETRNIFSRVATIIKATAKNIYSPFVTVTAAKAYSGDCKTPVATVTPGIDELILDRNIGNAIVDCETELSYANFPATELMRGALYRSVVKKLNTTTVTDVVADATVVAGALDLSTADKVRDFLIGVAADAGDSFEVRQTFDGGTATRCEYHGKPFIACGRDAFVNITSKIASIVNLSSLKGIDGNFVDTPYGVAVINLAEAADNTKRLIYGLAGAPTIGYRKDMIEVDMGKVVSETVQTTAADGDIAINDKIITDKFFIKANTKGKSGIFSNVATLVKTQLMA